MLGRNWCLSVNNNLSASATLTITARLWKFNSSGALVYSAEQTYSLGSIASSSTAWTENSFIDNSSDLYIGAELTVTVVPSASVTGTVTVQLWRSTDAGSTAPSDGLGEFVGAVAYSTSSSATVRTNMTVGA